MTDTVYYSRSEARKKIAELNSVVYELCDILQDPKAVKTVKDLIMNEERSYRKIKYRYRLITVKNTGNLFFIKNLIEFYLMPENNYPTHDEYFSLAESWFVCFCLYVKHKEKIDTFMKDKGYTYKDLKRWDYCKFVDPTLDKIHTL